MIESLARNLFQELKSIAPKVTEDLPEKEFRALTESLLRRMNLVSRDEFDAQQAVLGRCREKLESLEKQIADLESLVDGNTDQGTK